MLWLPMTVKCADASKPYVPGRCQPKLGSKPHCQHLLAASGSAAASDAVLLPMLHRWLLPKAFANPSALPTNHEVFSAFNGYVPEADRLTIPVPYNLRQHQLSQALDQAVAANLSAPGPGREAFRAHLQVLQPGSNLRLQMFLGCAWSPRCSALWSSFGFVFKLPVLMLPAHYVMEQPAPMGTARACVLVEVTEPNATTACGP